MKRNPLIGALSVLALASASITAAPTAQATVGDALCTVPSTEPRRSGPMVPFRAFDRETRTIIGTTSAIESINARYGRVTAGRT
ncbi:hypothetical protein [Embleya sp. NPDC020886]|uniref:hypothetical protein n=1 Tax=Embleya sp. NPDC020886 TaxID=3363980 RepID=UPI0037980704